MSEFTTHIDAPPELVFDEVSHVERHPSWANPRGMRMEQTAGDGPGAASHYISHAIFVKKPVSADIEITRYEPSTVFELLSHSTRRARRTRGSGTRSRSHRRAAAPRSRRRS